MNAGDEDMVVGRRPEVPPPNPRMASESVMDASRGDVFGSLLSKPTVQRFGRYIVLGLLGRGGMSVVLKCYDDELDRQVAVKVLHEEMSERHTARLRREAQAMARLSHPNVVQVYEIGEREGRTYVAMELVAGQTLREWMMREPRPSWRACVDVFLQLGAGLVAAHANGLVHRDFKPSNAIIDVDDRARLLDFGLARGASDEGALLPREDDREGVDPSSVLVGSSLTETGAILGTPAYMPLEQMSGREADARSDQFSFCVSLYEALYGERPYRGETLATLLMSMRAGKVRPPPKGSPVPNALRRVLLRGLASDPDERWSSMETLLDELHRVLTPLGRRWRTGLVVVMVGLGGSWAFGRYLQNKDRCTGAEMELVGVWDDARKARLRGAIMGTELPYARDTWARVEGTLDVYAGAWAEMHTEVCEATSVRQEQSAAVMDQRMGCLRDRRIALQEAVDVLVEAAPTRLAQAVPLVNSLPTLSRCEDVDALQAELPPPEDPDAANRVEALREQLVEVRTLLHAGDYDRALEQAELVTSKSESLGFAPLLAEALLERGVARQEKAQYEAAESDLERSYLLAAQLGHPEVASSAVRQLAFVVGHDQARHELGLQWGKTAVALARRDRADPREEATALSTIGVMLMNKGELAEALTHQQRALAIFEEAFGPEAPDISDLLLNMGNVLQKQGQLDEALKVLRRALTIREKTLGPHHPTVAGPLTTIGAVFIQKGELDAALKYMQRALVIREAGLGAYHPDVATALNNLGAVLKQRGELERSREQFQRALEILEESLGPTHPRLAYPLNNIGEVLRTQNEGQEALVYFQRALTVTEESLGKSHSDVASSLVNLGNLLYQEERYDDAKARYERALEIQTESLPADHPLIAWSQLGLAKIALKQERLADARRHSERAVRIREHATAPAVLRAEAHFLLARALWNDPSERARARELAVRARDAWQEAGDEDPHTKAYLEQVGQWLADHPVAPG